MSNTVYWCAGNSCEKWCTLFLLAVSDHKRLDQWFPSFFDTFLPLLILELFIPPLWDFHSSPIRVRRLVLTIHYNWNNGPYWQQ